MAQRADRGGRFLRRIDKVFGQRADDAVAAGIHLAEFVFVLAGGFDHAAGGGIDHRGYAAGLGVQNVHFCHGWGRTCAGKGSAIILPSTLPLAAAATTVVMRLSAGLSGPRTWS